MNNINHPPKVLLFSNRQREGNDCAAKRALSTLEGPGKIRMLFIEFCNYHQAWHDKLIRVGPGLLSLDLNTLYCINHNHGTVSDPKRGARVRDEGRISWRVYEAQFRFAVI